MKRSSLVASIILPGIAALAFGATGCAPSRVEAQKPLARAPVAIVVERAGAPAVRALFTGPGSVAATHTYRIAFEIPGRVTSIAADVGDRVDAGETLATIDDADYRAQLASARARAASAAANALRTRNGARPQERAQAGDAVAAARATMARSQSAVDLAARNDARDRSLLASGFVAAQAADTAHVAFVDAENQLSAARAQVAAAEHNRALVDAGPRDEDRTAAFADADAARANASLAQTTYAKTTIHAPVDAYVLSRDIELGSDAAPGVVAFVLTDAASPEVRVDVPERYVSELSLGRLAIVTANGRVRTGRVSRIEPAADPNSRTATVRVAVERLSARPGAVVSVSLAPQRDGGASVPLGAIVTHGDTSYVETYDAARGTVARRVVRTIAALDDRANVAGIAPGTPVVVMGQHQAEPGDRVRVVTSS